MHQFTAPEGTHEGEVSTHPKTCSVATCGQSGKIRRGLCGKHYQRWSKHGDPNVTVNLINQLGMPCFVDGCNRPSVSLKRCEMHYRRFRSHGDFDAIPRVKRQVQADPGGQP